VHDIAMQIAASNPRYISREDIPEKVLEKERELQRERALAEGKPAAVIERVVAGRMEKLLKEICLLDQPFIRNEEVTVGDLIKEKIARIGENIKVRRFARYELGSGEGPNGIA
jgi:elongation factor Ts